MGIHAYAVHSPKSELKPFEYEPGPLGPDEVEISVTHCGICHSDLEMIDNNWGMTTYPLVPGHEVVGTIAAVGPEVHGRRVGERVGLGWSSGSCLNCRYCLSGREHLCGVRPEGTIVGRPGGFADRVRCQARWAIPVPDGIASEVAGPMFCGGTTVWTPMLHYGVTPTMKTAVVGVGGLGHMAVQMLAKYGTDVTAISSSRRKEAEAREFGARAVITNDELDSHRDEFDYIICTVPTSMNWNALVAALAPQGRLVIVGVPDSDVSLAAFGMIAGERTVSGGRTGSPGDTEKMLEFCARHGIGAKVEQFAMKDVNQAVKHVHEGKARYRAVLVA